MPPQVRPAPGTPAHEPPDASRYQCRRLRRQRRGFPLKDADGPRLWAPEQIDGEQGDVRRRVLQSREYRSPIGECADERPGVEPQGLIAHQGVGVAQRGPDQNGASRLTNQRGWCRRQGDERQPPHLSVRVGGAGRGQRGLVGLLRRRERRERQAANPDEVLRIDHAAA